MHAPKGSWVARRDLGLESWLVGEDFCAVESAHGEGLGEGRFGD